GRNPEDRSEPQLDGRGTIDLGLQLLRLSSSWLGVPLPGHATVACLFTVALNSSKAGATRVDALRSNRLRRVADTRAALVTHQSRASAHRRRLWLPSQAVWRIRGSRSIARPW